MPTSGSWSEFPPFSGERSPGRRSPLIRSDFAFGAEISKGIGEPKPFDAGCRLSNLPEASGNDGASIGTAGARISSCSHRSDFDLQGASSPAPEACSHFASWRARAGSRQRRSRPVPAGRRRVHNPRVRMHIDGRSHVRYPASIEPVPPLSGRQCPRRQCPRRQKVIS